MKVCRRSFLGGLAAAGASPVWGGARGERLARIGLMTDTHVDRTMESCARVRAALRLFKAKGAEMVLNCGDIANTHCPEGYVCYRRTFNEVFPDAATRPKEVYAYAFHDICDFKPGTGWANIAENAAAAFENVRVKLEAPNPHTCDFMWKGLPFAVFPQSTGMKGFLSWADYERTVARLCAANPGKPVFVVDHVPPAGTTFHSRHWGCENLRKILNKFPQVVSISGHVHGSLASERQIWQGEFTAVNLGCLDTWGGFAPGSKPPPQAKPNFGVLVMDVYRDRLEIFRYDVRDGFECGEPWRVPLPFAAQEAPYRPEVAAKRAKKSAFAADAAVTVKPAGDGYAVEFPEASVGARAFMYRVECARRTAAGDWSVFTRDDIFGDFWIAEKDRTGRARFVLSAGFFDSGADYRVTVTPLDFFYRGTRPISCVFTAERGAKTVWRCAKPRELKFTEYGRPVAQGADGWYVPPSGQGTVWLPDGVFGTLATGKRHALVLDVETDQPAGDYCAWRVALRGRGGSWSRLAEVQTSTGRPGILRYVFEFTSRADTLKDADLTFNYASPGGRLRVAGVEIRAL